MISSTKVCWRNKKINATLFISSRAFVKRYVIVSAESCTEVTDIIIFVLFFITVTASRLTITLTFFNPWIQKIFISLLSFCMSSIRKFLTVFPLTSAGLK